MVNRLCIAGSMGWGDDRTSSISRVVSRGRLLAIQTLYPLFYFSINLSYVVILCVQLGLFLCHEESDDCH